MNKTNKQLFYIISGEDSGDLHGANLIEQFKKQTDTLLKFRGLGGPKMIKSGLTPIENFGRLAVMGFYEVFKNLMFFIKLKRKVIRDIIEHEPSKIVLIDYPGFNLKIAESIKKNTKINTKVYYYISPQLWAWKEKRLNTIKKYVDEMIVIFPFEVEWYHKRGVPVKYFGHPLLDNYSDLQRSEQKLVQALNERTGVDLLTIGLFPGSRKQEIAKHVPVMQRVIDRLEQFYDSCGETEPESLNKINVVVGVVDNKENYDVNPMFVSEKWAINYIDNSFEAFEKSDVAIVASGTATLECAMTETPMVVVYKMSTISWWISKYFIKIPFASIVNILSEKPMGVVKELLQTNCVSKKIVREIKKLLDFTGSYPFTTLAGTKQKREMKKIIKKLGHGDAYQQTAEFIIKS